MERSSATGFASSLRRKCSIVVSFLILRWPVGHGDKHHLPLLMPLRAARFAVIVPGLVAIIGGDGVGRNRSRVWVVPTLWAGAWFLERLY